jgi:hypothetical protein
MRAPRPDSNSSLLSSSSKRFGQRPGQTLGRSSREPRFGGAFFLPSAGLPLAGCPRASSALAIDRNGGSSTAREGT